MKLLLPAVIALMSLLVVPAAVGEELTDRQLHEAIESRLIGQLGDKETAAQLTRFLMQEVLTWKAETMAVDEADSIIAYAFGNRIAENGNKLPGTMNQQLADLVVDIYRESPVPVYAQWEIAEAIGDRVPAKHLVPVFPKIDNVGKVIYLSTSGVAEETARLAKGPGQLGKAVVVAFYEHHLRAVHLSREVGITAYGPEGYSLPREYDPESGQPWTRDNDIFTFYEVAVRASQVKERLIAERSK